MVRHITENGLSLLTVWKTTCYGARSQPFQPCMLSGDSLFPALPWRSSRCTPQAKVSDKPIWVPFEKKLICITVISKCLNSLFRVPMQTSALGKPTAVKYCTAGFQREQWPYFQTVQIAHRQCGPKTCSKQVPALKELPLLHQGKHILTAGLFGQQAPLTPVITSQTYSEVVADLWGRGDPS